MWVRVPLVEHHSTNTQLRQGCFKKKAGLAMKTVSRLYPWISVSFDDTLEDIQELSHHCEHCGATGTSLIDDNLTGVKGFEATHGACRKQKTQPSKLTVQ